MLAATCTASGVSYGGHANLFGSLNEGSRSCITEYSGLTAVRRRAAHSTVERLRPSLLLCARRYGFTLATRRTSASTCFASLSASTSLASNSVQTARSLAATAACLGLSASNVAAHAAYSSAPATC